MGRSKLPLESSRTFSISLCRIFNDFNCWHRRFLLIETNAWRNIFSRWWWFADDNSNIISIRWNFDSISIWIDRISLNRSVRHRFRLKWFLNMRKVTIFSLFLLVSGLGGKKKRFLFFFFSNRNTETIDNCKWIDREKKLFCFQR